MCNEVEKEFLKKKYNLSYHIPWLLRGEEEVGFSSMKVLEVGGSLPENLVMDDIKAKQWIAIEDFSYWRELPVDGGGYRPSNIPEVSLRIHQQIYRDIRF